MNQTPAADPSATLEQVRSILERHEKKLGDQLERHERKIEDRFNDVSKQLGAIKEQLAAKEPSDENRDTQIQANANQLKELDGRIDKVEKEQARHSWMPVLLSVFVLGILGSVGTAVWALVSSRGAAAAPPPPAAPTQPIIIYTTAPPSSP